jgi:hypothetical protein
MSIIPAARPTLYRVGKWTSPYRLAFQRLDIVPGFAAVEHVPEAGPLNGKEEMKKLSRIVRSLQLAMRRVGR